MNFKEEYQKRIDLIENILQKYLPEQNGYQKIIAEAMEYSLMAGGKRLRPMLMKESFELFGGKGKLVEPFMAAIEMIHTYSLIHDDLPCMDDDDLRRGRPTNHKVYGEATAVLAGDALLTAAFETIAEHGTSLGADKALAASACLGRAAGARGMVGGQALDMAGEGHSLSLSEVEELQRLKTGALISAAAEIGCIVAGGGAQERAAVRRYAELLGLAFQIRDDMLDVEGDEAKLGKPIGSDAANEKVTFVSLKGMEACEALVSEKTEAAKEALQSTFEDAGFLCWLADKLVKREK